MSLFERCLCSWRWWVCAPTAILMLMVYLPIAAFWSGVRFLSWACEIADQKIYKLDRAFSIFLTKLNLWGQAKNG